MFTEFKHPTPAPGVYDWSGSCAPGPGKSVIYKTFSVGVFCWEPKKSGGLKKGKVIKRFWGYTDDPDFVYQQADSYCRMKNEN